MRNKNILYAIVAVILVVVIYGLFAMRRRVAANSPPQSASNCPDVSGRVLPQCELERRRPESGRRYCPRGVCAEGLTPVPDFKTAYMICVPEGQSAEQACP